MNEGNYSIFYGNKNAPAFQAVGNTEVWTAPSDYSALPPHSCLWSLV